jgi:hypothetical protein
MNFLGAFSCLADTGCTLESQLKAAISMEPGEKGEKREGLDGQDKDTLANSVFQLPISYLAEVSNESLHELPDMVARDLELSILAAPSTDESKTTKTELPEKNMYEHILQPKTKFARDVIPAWKRHFTTDIPFLEQTQEVILNISSIIEGSKEGSEAETKEKEGTGGR